MATRIKHPGEIERGLSRERIEETAAADAMRLIEEGRFDALKTYVELKRYAIYLNALIDQFREPALRQAAEYETPVFEFMQARVCVSTLTKLDYSADPEWDALNRSIGSLQESRKEREAFLKTHNLVRREVDRSTGEIIEEFRVPVTTEQRLTIRL